MSEPLIAEIRLFAGNFAPAGWAFCHGQLLPIRNNAALFSLIGTIYGGDGRTTFALPDLRGRTPIQAGQGMGLDDYPLGERGGVEQVTLTPEQMPNHSHALMATEAIAEPLTPASHTLAMPEETAIYSPAEPTVVMAKNTVAATGSGQSHENRQPYLAINYIIALQGIFPSRG